MADPFIGEIRIVPYNFAPRFWGFCHGQLLSIAQNTALFSLLGTMYGGNGQTTFALPDLRGRVGVGIGQGPGLSNYDQGQVGGQETVTLTASQIPVHTHSVNVAPSTATSNSPAGLNLATATPSTGNSYGTGAGGEMPASAVRPVGGGAPHNNMQPYLVLNFIIALAGVFPTRP